MPRRRASVAPLTEFEVLSARIATLEKEVSTLKQVGASTIQTYDKDDYPDPVQGEIAVHFPGVHRPATPDDPVVYWHDQAWNGLGPDTPIDNVYPHRHAIHGLSLITECEQAQIGPFVFTLKTDGLTAGFATGLNAAGEQEPLYLESIADTSATLMYVFNLSKETAITVGTINKASGAIIKLQLATVTGGIPASWSYVDVLHQGGSPAVFDTSSLDPDQYERYYALVAGVKPDPAALPGGVGTAFNTTDLYTTFTGAYRGLHALKIKYSAPGFYGGGQDIRLYHVEFNNGPIK